MLNILVCVKQVPDVNLVKIDLRKSVQTQIFRMLLQE